jgi:hypothetical protein
VDALENNATTTNNNTSSSSSSIRIVDGQIIRPSNGDNSNDTNPLLPELLAPKTGTTGVQRNAAIPEVAPEADYWAYFGENAQRLDGKAPAVLKDVAGNPLDVRSLRAQAAAKRAAAADENRNGKNLEQLAGKTVAGQAVEPVTTTKNGTNPSSTGGTNSTTSNNAAAPVSKRQSRIGSKYSSLKNSAAFQGSANQFH